MTLNIHADSSPTHASNMRLLDATGEGTCLVTEWKENLHELFEPEKEVVTVLKRQTACLSIQKSVKRLQRQDRKDVYATTTYARRALEPNEIIKREYV
jgi:spore maturation protein CgeB